MSAIGRFFGRVADDAVDLPGSVVKGLWGTAGAAVQEARNNISENGLQDPTTSLLREINELRNVIGGDGGSNDTTLEQYEERNPFTGGLVQSFRNTGNRIVSLGALAPGGQAAGDSRIARDYGTNPLSTFIEDAGNIAMVAGPVSSAASRAGAASRLTEAASAGSRTASVTQSALETIGRGAGRTRTVGNAIADAPVSLPARLAGRAGSRVSEAISDAMPYGRNPDSRLAGIANVAERLHLDPDSRQRRSILRESEFARQADAQAIEADLRRQRRIFDNPVDEAAAIAAVEGEGAAYAALRDGGAPTETLDAFVAQRGRLSPEIDPMERRAVFERAADFATRSADDISAFDEWADLIRRQSMDDTARYLGEGGDAAQLRYEPLASELDTALAPLRERLANTTAEAARVRQQSTNAFSFADQVETGRANAINTRADRLELGAEGLLRRANEMADTPVNTTRSFSQELDRSLRLNEAVGNLRGRAQQAARQVDEMRGQSERIDPSRTRMRAEQWSRQADRLERRQARLERLIDQRTERLTTGGAATPARAQPILLAAGDARRLANEAVKGMDEASAARLIEEVQALPASLAELAANGAELPYLPHVASRWSREFSNAVNDATGASEPRISTRGRRQGPELRGGTQSTEVVRRGDRRYERDLGQMAQRRLRNVEIAQSRAARQQMIDGGLTYRWGEGPLTDGSWSESGRFIDQGFEHEPGVPSQRAAQDFLQRRGLAVWDLDSFDGTAPPSADAVIVPAQVQESVRSYHVSGRGEELARTLYDPLTRAFKANTLALSPAWHVGNVVGNTVMAVVSGGVDPITLVREMKTAIDDYRASGSRGDRQWNAPSRVTGSTTSAMDLREIGRAEAERPFSYSPISLLGNNRVVRASYQANAFIDNLYRTAVYNAKRGQGWSPEQATRQTLRAMGDFDNLSPFERNFVRRVVPFYTWMRHMIQTAWTLPVEHPARTAMTLHVADVFADPDDELPSWMRWNLLLGNESVATSAFNPYAGVVELKPDASLLRNLSPQLKTTLGVGLGINLDRPNGNDALQFLGEDGEQMDFSDRLANAPEMVFQNFAPRQQRLFDSVTGHNQIRRWDDGSPRPTMVDGAETYPSTGRSLERSLLQYLGINARPYDAEVERQREFAEREERERMIENESFIDRLRRLRFEREAGRIFDGLPLSVERIWGPGGMVERE